MHSHRNSERALASSRATGLGICDALRLTLEQAQVPWLLDEVDETRRALEQRAPAQASVIRTRSARSTTDCMCCG
jgi:hypothetical protein